MRASRTSVAFVVALAVVCAGTQATVYEIEPTTTIVSMLPVLQPGDTLVLKAGTHNRAFISNLNGTADGWITIKGADGVRPTIYYASYDRNVIDLSNCSYVKLQNLEITGGSDGVKFAANTSSHDIVLEDLYIHHVGGGGVNASGVNEVYNLTVRGCEIAFTGGNGEGFYLGRHGGYTYKQVHDSLIERCYVHDMGGNQGDGLELKHGSNRVVVQDNVFRVPRGYPAITSWGTYKNDPSYNNTIRRNLVIGSTDAGIHVTGEINIENNIVYSSLQRGIHCRKRDYDGKMQYTRIVNNTVYMAGGDALHLVNWNQGTDLVLANNVIYQASALDSAVNAVDGVVAATVAGNLYYGLMVNGQEATPPAGLTEGPAPALVFLNPSALLSEVDLYPLVGGPLTDAGDAGLAPTEDFQTVFRPQGGGVDIGAYEPITDFNAGWKLASGFKKPGPPGDLDGSGFVGVSDVLILAGSWNTRQGDTGYDPACDLDRDGAINIFDIFVIAEYWSL